MEEKNPFENLGKKRNLATNSNPREPLTKEELETDKTLIFRGGWA